MASAVWLRLQLLCVQKSQCAVAELLLARGAAVDGASADSPLSLAVLVRRCCAAPQCATAACLTEVAMSGSTTGWTWHACYWRTGPMSTTLCR